MHAKLPLAGTRWRIPRPLLAFVALLALLSAVLAAAIYGHAHSGTAASFSVTDCTQYGTAATAGTLAAALAGASGVSGATIAFDCASGGTIVVPATIAITSSITFSAGSTSATLSGNSQTALFSLSGGIAVTFAGLTLADGATTAGNADGGAIFNDGATLTLTNMTLSGNAVRGYYSDGGALYNRGGAVTITASTFSGNIAAGTGGGSDSAGDGGAIFNIAGGTVHIANSTFSGNSASGTGGGYGGALNNADAQSAIFVVNSTFAGNTTQTAGAAAYINNGTVAFTNTLLANASGGHNCGGLFPTDGGNNLEDANTCGFSAANHDLINVSDPKLGTLGGYGGPTMTIPLDPGSPAINAGNLADCPAVDQRGTSRPQGTSCDIGAFELALPTGQLSAGSPSYTPSGQPTYVTNQTPLTLSGVDAGSGVGAIAYCLFPQGATCGVFTSTTHLPAVLTVPIADADGQYELDYFASDSAGDVGRTLRSVVILDATSPTSTLSVQSGPITPSDPLTVTASDLGSGVQRVAYRAYQQGGTPPAFTVVSGTSATFTIHGPAGTYTVEWFATDHLGNTEVVQSQTVIVVIPTPTARPTPTATTPPPASPTNTPTPNGGGQTANTAPTATPSVTATAAPVGSPTPTATQLPPPAPPAHPTPMPPISVLLLVIVVAVLIMAAGALVLVRRSRHTP